MEDNTQEEFVEIDLREYIMVLVERWKLIASIFLVTVLLAGVYAFVIAEPVYQVEAELMRSKPSYKTEFNAEIFNKREYKRIFSSAALAEQVINALNLDKDKYNADKLLRATTVSIDNAAEDEETTQLINIKYNTASPSIGKNIVVQWMDFFQEKSLNLLKEEVKVAQRTITNQYQNYKTEVNKLQEQYDEFQNKNQIQLLKNKINKRENKIVNYEDRLLDIKKQISQKTALVKELKSSLEAEDRIYELNRAIFDDEMLDNLSINLGDGQIKTEELNPLYIEFKRKLENNQADLEQLKAEKDILGSSLKTLDQEVVSLRAKLTKQQRRLTELELELNTTEKKYNKLYNQRQEVETALEIQSSGVSIVSSPVEPQQPIKPNKKLIIAIAGVLGLMLGAFAAFGTEFLVGLKNEVSVTN